MGAPLVQAGEQESRGAQVGGSGGRHSGAGRVPVTAALWSRLCRVRGLSGPEVLGVKSGECCVQRPVCVVGWSPVRWTHRSELSDL